MLRIADPPAGRCLELEGVKAAHFWLANGRWTGLVAAIGQELDVRQVARRRWYASDDDGKCHYGRSAKVAVRRAIEANS